MLFRSGEGAFALFVSGGLWLALWRGPVRLAGMVPALLGLVLLLQVRAPDVLISGDGRHVGITGEAAGELLVLRATRSDYTRDNLTETAGMAGELRLLDDWPGARCNPDFCAITLRRGARDWQVLMARGTVLVSERALAAACERADIVISERYLPRSCRPRWLRADRDLLQRTGGLTADLTEREIETVAHSEGAHGWWNPPVRVPRRLNAPQPSATADAASAVTKPVALPGAALPATQTPPPPS